MKARVTEEAVVIPKKFLRGIKEVEIRQEGEIIVVLPKTKEDALFKLGRHPISCNAPDASENLDDYLY